MKAMRHIHLYIYLPFFALLAHTLRLRGRGAFCPEGGGHRVSPAYAGGYLGRCFRRGGDEGGNAYVARYVYSRKNGFHD